MKLLESRHLTFPLISLKETVIEYHFWNYLIKNEQHLMFDTASWLDVDSNNSNISISTFQ